MNNKTILISVIAIIIFVGGIIGAYFAGRAFMQNETASKSATTSSTTNQESSQQQVDADEKELQAIDQELKQLDQQQAQDAKDLQDLSQ